MTTRSSDKNLFFNLKTKQKFIRTDIKFLQKCNRLKVIPNFIKVKCALSNTQAKKAKRKAELEWLHQEINHKFFLLHANEIKTYELHLKLTKNLTLNEYSTWCEFERRMHEVINNKITLKNIRLNKKLKHLKIKQVKSPMTYKPLPSVNSVYNHSTQVFSEKELEILDKGLNYVPPPVRCPKMDLVAETESSITYMPTLAKQSIRDQMQQLISAPFRPSKEDLEITNTIEDLTKKDCHYIKADKGNSIVILDKAEYENRMLNELNNGGYKNPAPKNDPRNRRHNR